MSDYIIAKRSDIIAVADAVRGNSDITKEITLGEIIDGVEIVAEGGVDTSDATATASDIISGKTAYVDGVKITGDIEKVQQSTPSITVSPSGLITAISTQEIGYVSGGTKTKTTQLPTESEKTITPTKSTQTAVSSGKYTTGNITVNPIPDEYIVTTDATASATDILNGKTAYAGGKKVTGSIATKTSSDLTVSGEKVTVPAGYYASNAEKSVATADRANTTISITADDTNDKLTITASNNQTTGYVTGANKTATTTISLSASGATVTASDGINKISKSVATATQATPSISVDSNGFITASATQSAGYVSAGTKSGTKQLTTQVAKTITPSKSSQTAVASGVYTTGAVTVDAIPSNYITTSDATAQASEIFQGETAYVNGNKVTGTFTIQDEVSSQTDLISQITTVLEKKASYNTIFVGTAAPTSDIGVDGDIYIVRGETS